MRPPTSTGRFAPRRPGSRAPAPRSGYNYAMRRRELFPPDRRLQARMVVASIGTPLVVLAAVVAVVALLPFKLAIGLGIAAVVGIVVSLRARREASHARLLGPGEEPELRGIVERLCVVGDLPRPDIAVDAERLPNSWIPALPGRPPRLHVTRGLLDALTATELEAVVAHELAHVANRDATVMTL